MDLKVHELGDAFYGKFMVSSNAGLRYPFVTRDYQLQSIPLARRKQLSTMYYERLLCDLGNSILVRLVPVHPFLTGISSENSIAEKNKATWP